MAIFSWGREKGTLALVFDLGSSSVGGALFRMPESGIPKIIFAAREPIPLGESVNPGRLLSATIKTLDLVAGKIHRSGLGAPKRVFCVLSSPWHLSQTRIIRLAKNTPFVFNEKLAFGLIQKETALFEKEHMSVLVNGKSPVRRFELKNIKTMLNGYETGSPLEKKAEDLEMTIFISIAGELFLKKIEETIGRHFHGREIKFSSFTLASFTVLRGMYAEQEDFLLIDVGGELTDISMVKRNALRESASFPIGGNYFIRGVASALRTSTEEARSLISLFNSRHANASAAKRIEPVMRQLKSDWLAKFQESLANISNDISIPAMICLFASKDLKDFFCGAIENEQFNQYTLTEAKFKVLLLATELFHGMAEFDGEAARDPGLIIDCLYINRFLNKS